jgi:hypothetical protein
VGAYCHATTRHPLGGNTITSRDPSSTVREAWREFLRFTPVCGNTGPMVITWGGVLLIIALVAYGQERGFAGVVSVLQFASWRFYGDDAARAAAAKAQRISSVIISSRSRSQHASTRRQQGQFPKS